MNHFSLKRFLICLCFISLTSLGATISPTAAQHAARMGKVFALTDFVHRISSQNPRFELYAYGGTSRELDDFVHARTIALGGTSAFDTWIDGQSVIAINEWHSADRDLDLVLNSKEPDETLKRTKDTKFSLLNDHEVSPEFKSLDLIIPPLFFEKFPITGEHYEPTSNVMISANGYADTWNYLDVKLNGQIFNLGQLGIEAMAQRRIFFFENPEIIRHRFGSQDLTNFRQIVRWIRLISESNDKTLDPDSERELQNLSPKFDIDNVVNWLQDAENDEERDLEKHRILDTIIKAYTHSKNPNLTERLMAEHRITDTLDSAEIEFVAPAYFVAPQNDRVLRLATLAQEIRSENSSEIRTKLITEFSKLIYPEYYSGDIALLKQFDDSPDISRQIWETYLSQTGFTILSANNPDDRKWIKSKLLALLEDTEFHSKLFFQRIVRSYSFLPADARVVIQELIEHRLSSVSGQYTTLVGLLKTLRLIVAANPNFVEDMPKSLWNSIFSLGMRRFGGHIIDDYLLTLRSFASSNPEAFHKVLPMMAGLLEGYQYFLATKDVRQFEYWETYALLLTLYPNEKSLVTYQLLKNVAFLERFQPGPKEGYIYAIASLALEHFDDLGIFRKTIVKAYHRSVGVITTMKLLQLSHEKLRKYFLMCNIDSSIVHEKTISSFLRNQNREDPGFQELLTLIHIAPEKVKPLLLNNFFLHNLLIWNLVSKAEYSELKSKAKKLRGQTHKPLKKCDDLVLKAAEPSQNGRPSD